MPKNKDSAYTLMMQSLKTLEARAKSIHAPEDEMVKALCEKIGYGALIDSAARQWFLKDPMGSIVPGWCAGTVRSLKGQDRFLRVFGRAKRFAKAWAIWSVNDQKFPDEDVLESAGSLMDAVGVKQPEEAD